MLPDFYRGQWCAPSSDELMTFIKTETKWERLKVDCDKVIEFAKNKGAKVFGSVGKKAPYTLQLQMPKHFFIFLYIHRLLMLNNPLDKCVQSSYYPYESIELHDNISKLSASFVKFQLN